MPVAVGVIVAMIFLIAFSGWFYHLAMGWSEFVLDDVYFKYRIIGASLLSIVIITTTFMSLAYALECPNEERQGFFASLNCADYRNIKVGAESLFKRNAVKTDEVPGSTVEEGDFIFDR